jgi:U3 small nucleolar RNA-associated protein 18
MGKRANKRQKTEKDAPARVHPLGSQIAVSLLDDAAKDDEERRLESILFGTKYVPAAIHEDHIHVSDEEDADVGGGQELQNLTDTDVRLFATLDSTISFNTSTAIFCRRRHRCCGCRTIVFCF